MTGRSADWPHVSLGNLALGGVFSDGDWIETKDQDPTGSVRLTQLADVGVAAFRDRSSRWLREDQASRLGCTFLEPGDILIARMPDPIGRACLVPATVGRAVTAVDVAVLRIRRIDVDPQYVMWAINSPDFHARVVALESGTTRKRISRRNLSALTVPLPPLEEQRRIVDILEDHLSRIDAASNYLAAALRRSEVLAAAEVWQLTHRGKASPRSRLDEVAEVRLGRQRSPANHQGERMRPYLRAANVDWNRLRLDDIKEMNFTAAEERTFLLEPGDILVVEASGSAAEVGKSAIYEGMPANVCFQNTLLRVRCGPAAVPLFLQKYLLAEALAGRFIEGSRGVGINHVGRAKLAGLEVSLPEVGEQQVLAERCALALGAVEALTSSLRLTRQRGISLRRGVLDAAFSGRLTGRSSDSDSAEELASV